jgi:hypothetical protein
VSGGLWAREGGCVVCREDRSFAGVTRGGVTGMGEVGEIGGSRAGRQSWGDAGAGTRSGRRRGCGLGG